MCLNNLVHKILIHTLKLKRKHDLYDTDLYLIHATAHYKVFRNQFSLCQLKDNVFLKPIIFAVKTPK